MACGSRTGLPGHLGAKSELRISWFTVGRTSTTSAGSQGSRSFWSRSIPADMFTLMQQLTNTDPAGAPVLAQA